MLKTFLINKIFGNNCIHCTVQNNIAFQIHYIRRGQGENHAQVLHKMAPPPFYPILGLMSSLVDISGSHTRWRPPQFFHILGLMSSLVEIFGSRTRWHPPPTFYPIWVLCRRWQVPWSRTRWPPPPPFYLLIINSSPAVGRLWYLADFTTILTEPSVGQFCQLETGHDFRGQRQPYPYQGETFLSFYIPTF